MQRVLDSASEAQLKDARQVLSALGNTLAQFGATEDLHTLNASIHQLDDLFLLVVAGEFNAGKSAAINALVGRAILEEGVIPTTAQLHLLTWGESVSVQPGPDGVRHVSAPVDLLRDVHIVDTPGTNAIIREHEKLTTDFVPRSDMVLFITSADRPFTETERQFLENLRRWGKKIAIVVNKIDLVSNAAERDQVLAFVARGAHDLLGIRPPVLGVSARLAMRAKNGEPQVWHASGFDALEDLVRDTLRPESRFHLKLANPLGVGSALVDRYIAVARERLTLLRNDVELLEELKRQTSLYEGDLQRGFELRMDAIAKVLGEMEARGNRYFENTLRIGRVVDLLNRSRVQKEFTDTVVADVPVQIERRVTEMIDWLVDQDFRQWQSVTSTLADRQKDLAGRMLGAPDVGTFHNDRSRLIESVGREAQRAVESYDKHREADLIADQARVAVAAAAAAGGAAVGLGTIVTVAASTVAADVTGILLASLMLGVGFLIIPARRRRAKLVLEQKIAALSERIRGSLRTEFENARSRSALRLQDGVAPYARFVHAEESRWAEALQTLEALGARITKLLESSRSVSGGGEQSVS
jgi:GTP-binding protein EngB required for normal cell division